MKMIKNMVKVRIHGIMEENILVDGIKENNMEKDI
jgi:hypothetical protein